MHRGVFSGNAWERTPFLHPFFLLLPLFSLQCSASQTSDKCSTTEPHSQTTNFSEQTGWSRQRANFHRCWAKHSINRGQGTVLTGQGNPGPWTLIAWSRPIRTVTNKGRSWVLPGTTQSSLGENFYLKGP